MAAPPSRQLPFAIVMRGYDREQVADRLQRLDAELRVLGADRDAATANAQELAAHLEQARDEIADLRREVDKLSVPPTTAQGMSERLSRMLQLAADEASEMRAEASAEAAETISVARQEAHELRTRAQADADRTRLDANAAAKALNDGAQTRAREINEAASAHQAESARLIAERTAAMEAEHIRTMTAANNEARRIVEGAESYAAALDETSTRERRAEREQHDAAIAAERELSAQDAARVKQTALDIATERLARSRELAAAADQKRATIAERLEQVRVTLTELPDKLASPDDIDYAGMSDTDDLTRLNDRLSKAAGTGPRSGSPQPLNSHPVSGQSNSVAPPHHNAGQGDPAQRQNNEPATDKFGKSSVTR